MTLSLAVLPEVFPFFVLLLAGDYKKWRAVSKWLIQGPVDHPKVDGLDTPPTIRNIGPLAESGVKKPTFSGLAFLGTGGAVRA